LPSFFQLEISSEPVKIPGQTRKRLKKYLLRKLATTIALFTFLGTVGCVSDHPGSGSLAYVDVEAQGDDAVRAGTIRVFEDDGYTLKESGEELVFEREATRRDKVFFKQYGDDWLVMRVVVSIEPRRAGGCLVRADAFAIHDGREEAVPWIARRPYQKQLDRVKANLVTSGGGGEGVR
jgi:hypothetical protein